MRRDPTLDMPTRTSALLLGVLVVAALALLASPARAHASLEGGSVSDGEVLDVAPGELFLDFNEAVTAPAGGLRVHDSTGRRVDEGGTFSTPDAPDQVRVGLEEDLPDGTYAVTFRVTSADGHPIHGALLFSVGEEAAGGEQVLGQVFSSDADRPWVIAAAIVRWAVYGAALLAAGAVLAGAWLRRGLQDDATARSRVVRRAAVVVLGGSVLGVLLQAVLVTGDGWAALVDPSGLAGVVGSFVGISAVVRVLGAAVLLAGLRRVGPVALIGAALVLGSFLLEGHTLTTGPATVVWSADLVHLLTAATWVGGLALLSIELRHRRRADDPVAAGRLVARYSSLFTVSVVAVVAAGIALSWVEVRALRAVTSTTYGWVLLGKLAAVAPLLLIGTYNNRRLVPQLTARRRRRRTTAEAGQPVIAGGSDEAADRAAQRDGAWATLRRTVAVELGLVAVVLGLTAVLVSLQPAAEAAGVTGAYSVTQEFEGLGQLTLTVDPNRVGRNEMHLYLLSDVGRILDIDEGVTLRLSQPDLDIGPIERTPVFAGKGHFILTGPELSVPGRWEITTEVQLNRFDVATTTTEVTVNP